VGSSLPLTITCSCGSEGRVRLDGRAEEGTTAWHCPACGAAWRLADDDGRLAGAARELAGIRRLAVLVPALAALAAVVLAVAHPAWLLMVPLVIGGAVTVFRPRYQRRLRRLYAGMPGATRVVAAELR
jgi:Flp pilus assembly protein TadB